MSARELAPEKAYSYFGHLFEVPFDKSVKLKSQQGPRSNLPVTDRKMTVSDHYFTIQK
jgi:hypothetical protein